VPPVIWLLLAGWAALPYLASRWPEEPVSLAAALGLAFLSRGRGVPALAGLLLYGVLRPWAPDLVCAGVLLTTFAAGSSRAAAGRVLPGWLGLALLSLPGLASLQFFFGYPARVASAEAARWLLGLQGFPVVRDGPELICGTRRLLVDAPCSGLGMLWTTLLFAVGLAAVRRSGWRATLRCVGVAVLAAWVANVLRLTGLFYSELLLGRPELHGPIGVVCFGLGLVVVAGLGPAAGAAGEGRAVAASRFVPLVALLVALVPQLTPAPVAFPGWPLPVEEVRVEGFPGRVARAREGDDVLLLRWVDRPTRALHSSLECLRGARGSSSAFTWQGWEGQEYVEDADGRRYADVSLWFWEAMLGRSRGPWLAVTRLTPAGGEGR